MAGLPLLVGYFSLNVPSGLSLYYFANSIFTTAISIYLKKLGGMWVIVTRVMLHDCCIRCKRERV